MPRGGRGEHPININQGTMQGRSPAASNNPPYGATTQTASNNPSYGATAQTASNKPPYGATAQTASNKPPYGATTQTASNNSPYGATTQTARSHNFSGVPLPAAQQPWQYTCLNNVKILYNVGDAKNYVRNLANTLEINNQENNEDFIEELLHKVEGAPNSSGGPIEYLFNGDHEKCYILVLVQKKQGAVAVGYSYHSVIDVVPNNASVETILMPNQRIWEYFKRRAYESLKLPAGLVANMVKNRKQLNKFQNRQLSLDQPQQEMIKISGDNTVPSSVDENTGVDLFSGIF